MSGFPEPLQALIDELRRLPGIGSRSAERLAFFLMKADAADAMRLAEAIADVKRRVMTCASCLNFCEGPRCALCDDPARDHGLVMVVEHPKDLVAFERTGRYRGVYHVLLGHLSPLEGSSMRHLSTDRLAARVRGGGVREVIIATNPDAEGDATALALQDLLMPLGVAVTRLARGLPTGSTIEYAGTESLADAVHGRRAVAPVLAPAPRGDAE